MRCFGLLPSLLLIVSLNSSAFEESDGNMTFAMGTSRARILCSIYEDKEWLAKEAVLSAAAESGKTEELKAQLKKEWEIVGAFFKKDSPPEWVSLLAPPKKLVLALFAAGTYASTPEELRALTECFSTVAGIHQAAGKATLEQFPIEKLTGTPIAATGTFPSDDPLVIILAHVCSLALDNILEAVSKNTISVDPAAAAILREYQAFQAAMGQMQGEKLAQTLQEKPQDAAVLNAANSKPDQASRRMLEIKLISIDLDERSRCYQNNGKSYAETILRFCDGVRASMT